MKDLLKAIFTIVAAVVIGNTNGCAHLTKSAKQLEQEYRQAVLTCVAKAKDPEEARECWFDVNESYGLCRPSKMPEMGLCRDDYVPGAFVDKESIERNL